MRNRFIRKKTDFTITPITKKKKKKVPRREIIIKTISVSLSHTHTHDAHTTSSKKKEKKMLLIRRRNHPMKDAFFVPPSQPCARAICHHLSFSGNESYQRRRRKRTHLLNGVHVSSSKGAVFHLERQPLGEHHRPRSAISVKDRSADGSLQPSPRLLPRLRILEPGPALWLPGKGVLRLRKRSEKNELSDTIAFAKYTILLNIPST